MRRRKKGLNAFIPFADVGFAYFFVILSAFAILHNPEPPVPESDPDDQALEIKAQWDVCLEEKSDGERKIGMSRSDVDLWAEALTAEGEYVTGFRQKKTKILMLDLDDYGFQGNSDGDKNEEVIKARVQNLPAGTYTANIHMYGMRGEYPPVCVAMQVTVNKGRRGRKKEVFNDVIELSGSGQEETAVIFEVDEDGNVVEDSVKVRPDLHPIATRSYSFR